MASKRAAPTLRQNGVKKVDNRTSEAAAAEVILWNLGKINDGWIPEDGDTKSGIQIFSRSTGKDLPKIWKCTGEVLASADEVARLMMDVNLMPTWNKDVTSYRLLETIDAQTDVVQCVSTSAMSGAVSPRDFVILRRRAIRDSKYTLISDTGTTHSSATTFPKVIRGWNGPGGLIVKRLGPTKSWVCWIVNKDLKGWIPKTIIDQVFSGVLVNWLKNLRSALAPSKPPPPPKSIQNNFPTTKTVTVAH